MEQGGNDRRTRREKPISPPTRRDDGGADGRTRRDGTEGGDGIGSRSRHIRVHLLPSLAEHFTPVEELRSGGEAIVIRVADRQDRPYVVKMYNPGLTFDETAAALLAQAEPDHIVRVLHAGTELETRYEVLEWCKHGSLTDLLDAGTELDLTRVITELTEALDHIHGLKDPMDPEARLIHRDLKPDNILVRDLEPLDLVLGDFGLARMIQGSAHYTRRQQGTRPWAPPSGEADSPAGDWWSLGMVIATIAGGRHPLALADGTLPEDVVVSDLLTRSVDLSAIEDERVQHLCRGLFLRDATLRWRGAEVRRWLAGDDIALPADDAPRVVAGARRVQPVLFGTVECSTPIALATALQADWDNAQQQLIQRSDGGLLHRQVTTFLADFDMPGAIQLLTDRSDPPGLLAKLLVMLDPELKPEFRGQDLRPTRLARYLNERDSAAKAVELIEKNGVATSGVLTAWRNLEGMVGAPDVERRLLAAKAFLEQHETILGGPGGRSGLSGKTPADRDRIKASVYLVAVRPEAAEGVRGQLRSKDTRAAEQQAWWRQLANDEGDHGVALAYWLLDDATGQSEQERERRRAQEAEEQRQAEERAARERAARLEARRQRLAQHTRWSTRGQVITTGFVALVALGLYLVHRSADELTETVGTLTAEDRLGAAEWLARLVRWSAWFPWFVGLFFVGVATVVLGRRARATESRVNPVIALRSLQVVSAVHVLAVPVLVPFALRWAFASRAALHPTGPNRRMRYWAVTGSLLLAAQAIGLTILTRTTWWPEFVGTWSPSTQFTYATDWPSVLDPARVGDDFGWLGPWDAVAAIVGAVVAWRGYARTTPAETWGAGIVAGLALVGTVATLAVALPIAAVLLALFVVTGVVTAALH